MIDNLQPTYVLSGASNRIQLKENMKALDFSFSEDEILLLKGLKGSAKDYWEERSKLIWN